ncbi:GNAT family N-acetyltransferase [Streptomyces tropicalis]|uniref:GNAT family N-acetyltransferase n=1 Tax=Streptomyces tropicalis TaxID=3034234 RepID=A0ABT6A825_9ACTN|nr:GNAT family N-acetyltransferase [Streptomyces tropicalis]MDF3300516.1 GNAT family N-acetyltransferase [Streptomyces tropicalis]
MTRDLPDPGDLSSVRLSGGGLWLRPWDPASDADVDAFLRGVTDREFARWNTPLTPITDRATAREALRTRGEQAAAGTAVPFLIAEAEDGPAVGHLGVNEIRRVFGRAIVGYWVLPEARGRGVATRALDLAARWSFDALGLHRLELGHAVGHAASCTIAERCGFRYEGTLRGEMFEEGRRDAFRDAHLHARLAADPVPGAGTPAGA